MWQAEFKLYLYPEDSDATISKEALKSALAECQFIGPLIEGNRHETGERFLSLLCFMGCSPNIELAPQDNKPYCYIEIADTQGDKRFIAGHNARKHQCPACKQTVQNIKALINAAIKNRLQYFNCPECDQHIEYKKINWRKSAFIAKNWIVVGNIYEAEAIPDENLLAKLERSTGSRWKYAYIRNPGD